MQLQIHLHSMIGLTTETDFALGWKDCKASQIWSGFRTV